MNTLRFKCFRAANVVLPHGIAAVDDGVAGFELVGECHDGLLRRIARRNHHPYRARFAELLDEIVERAAGDCAFLCNCINGVGAQVRNNDLMASAHQAAHHVAAHSS